MSNCGIIIGNSDGIGLAATRALLAKGWQLTGISRSASPITQAGYRHIVADVQSDDYLVQLTDSMGHYPRIDLCIFCVGIGELLDPTDMAAEATIIDVNFTSMVRTAGVVIPAMVAQGGGHFIGLSSLADAMLSPQAPSYHASKAGFSNYVEGLALALKPKGVHVSNVRFGFVDTKMAKGDVRPFMISVDGAVRHLLVCIRKRPIRYSTPWPMILLVWLRAWMLRLQL